MKHFFFLSGLPRSGSTVLSAILSQNPNLHASPNSCLVELLVNVRNHLNTTEQARATMTSNQKSDILHGIMQSMYSFTEKNYILDKSRAWPHPENIKLLENLLPYQPKFVATVRDLPGILASFIRKIEENPEQESFVDAALHKAHKEITPENRCEILFSPGGTVYESWASLQMAFVADFSKYFYLIDYDDFMQSPEEILKEVYEFLELDNFEHDLHNIVNTTPEDDRVYNIAGLHDVRKILKKTSPNPESILGKKLVQKYSNINHFWHESNRLQRATFNPFELKQV